MNYLEEYEKYEKMGHDIFKIVTQIPKEQAGIMSSLIDVHIQVEKKKNDIYKQILEVLR